MKTTLILTILTALSSALPQGVLAQVSPKQLEPPGFVRAPQETGPTPNESVARKIAELRRHGDQEGAAILLRKLSQEPHDAPVVPSDKGAMTVVIKSGTSDKFELPNDVNRPEWSTDVPVLTSSVPERSPSMIEIAGVSLTPQIILAGEYWTGGALDNIEIRSSSNHGQSWGSAVFINNSYPLAKPKIAQASDTQVGIVAELQYSSSNNDILYVRLGTDLSTSSIVNIDASTANELRPAIATDYHEYPTGAYLYVIYYKYGSSSSSLIFRRSTNLGTSWVAPVTVATFTSPYNPSCSMSFRQNQLMVAYTIRGSSSDDIAVAKSIDWGITWSSPVVVAGTAKDEYYPTLTQATASTAFLVCEYAYSSTDHDIKMAYTTDGGSLWTTNQNVSSSTDDERFPSVQVFGAGSSADVFRGYLNLTSNQMLLQSAQYTSPATWSPAQSIKSGSAVVSNDDPIALLPKYSPTGGVGVALAWCENHSGLDVYFNASWLGSPGTKTIQIVSPNGGENWQSGTTHNITWTSSYITNVKLDYSTNNGSSWTPIAASVAATPSSFPWEVPPVSSAQCLVRAGNAPDGTPSDQSNAVFTISIPSGASIKPVTTLSSYPAGSEFLVQVKVGDPTNVANLYGVSLKLTSDNPLCTYVDGSAAVGTFLGSNVITFFQKVNSRTVDMTVTKTSGSGSSGSGVVATAKFVTPSTTQSDFYVHFSLDGVTATNPSGVAVVLSPLPLTVTITGGTVTVWPGDCDNNGTVSGADVLKIGLYYGQARPGANVPGTAWQGYIRSTWPSDNPPAKLYADANGDGTINGADVLAVGLNYAKSHPSQKISLSASTQSEGVAGSGRLQLNLGSRELQGEDVPVDIQIDCSQPVFGVSFKLAYSEGENPLDIRLSPDKGVLGDVLQFSKLVAEDRALDIAVTCVAGGGFIGKGLLARLFVHPTFSRPPLKLKISDITANDAVGNPVILCGSDLMVSDIAFQDKTKPTEFTLAANYPNPFNPETMISFDLPIDGNVSLTVFDVLGRYVTTLSRGPHTAGTHSVKWAGLDERGIPAGSGVYVYVLTVRNSDNPRLFTQSRRMVLIR